MVGSIGKIVSASQAPAAPRTCAASRTWAGRPNARRESLGAVMVEQIGVGLAQDRLVARRLRHRRFDVVGHHRDKGLVEQGVLHAERWVLAPLRNHIFRDLASMNRAIAAQVKKINSRPCADGTGENRATAASRASTSPTIRPLPDRRWQRTVWRQNTVHPDYHTSPSTGTSTRCPTSMSARRSMCADRRRDLQATRSPTGVDSGTAGNICSRCPPSRTAPARSMGSSRIGMTFSTCPGRQG